ncbi:MULTISPECIES: L,D-transpeptidase family protein [Rahnella]|jgi:L,D-transpeptidase YcfS|uniref:L,D-transpeptidase family protein n=1 Tax=Rahnella laticis TaxID=2787622 RepID=A0ABS0E5L9_9GAMM|nr:MULTISPECIES: L,D-transpeptidase family protein [Rahnella]KAB8308666.1 L,D-transpeptidase [Rouxiella chamberiensis]MBF7980396.1 L,D-transpeptidase family protein [Rahnella laticis]MBF8000345.1 L,D-transpeptidase family protein [Rahnella sp. LAC-M12]MBU9821749.1 L,D-transpeptidase family protein [Rahnella sp. BCC 1045]MCS3421772.1 L,D-transpeptidase ErfK/SrfK/L,D-transpeptidase YcfS [Rahnella sp. BIGb0603]
MRRALPLLAMLVGTFLTTHSMTAGAAEYPLPPDNSRLIGENTTYVVPNDGKPLEDVAAKYQIGLIAMLEANPGTDPYLPKAGTVLTIPSQMLLPDTKREGIVVNLAELRLYYYPKGEDKVIVYPIGIGQLGRNTPEMVTSVSQKIPNPTWTPTANIRKAYLKDGITLPGMVPAGPDNPMGLFAMRLSAGTGQYLIHGTNANFGIGMRVSSGCIRLRPDDIEALFNSVPKGTRVQIVNQPIKFDVEPDGKRYIEVHQPLSHTEKDDPQTKPILLTAAMKKFIKSDDTNAEIVKEAIRRRSGMPVVVSVGDKATDMPPAANAPQTVSADTPAVTTASTQ